MKKQLLSIFILLVGIVFPMSAYTLVRGDGDKGEITVDASESFYDAGGQSGTAQKSTGSTVTFAAKDASKQLALNFTSIDLSSTSTSIYVYDGDCTYTSWNKIPEGWALQIDASMTSATFKSTTGKISIFYKSSYSESGDGWEATVTEFTPAPMTFNSIEVSQDFMVDAPLASSNQALYSVNIQTDGSLNPIATTELQYDLAGTTAIGDLDSLKLYYSAGVNQFGGAQKVAVAAMPLSMTGAFNLNQNLASGDNYFWIVADLASHTDNATHVLDVKCIQATVAGAVQAVATPEVDGVVTILNELRTENGARSLNVTHTAIPVYDGGGKDAKVLKTNGSITFVPAVASDKVKFTVSSVELYSSDQLNVYNGSGVDAAQLLGQVKYAKDLTTFYSSATDGSLTVEFISTTNYPKNGFEASVESFTPENMTYVATTVAQKNAGETVSSGQMGVEVLGMNVTTEHTLNALTLDALTLTLPNYASISKVALYATPSSETFATDSLVAMIENPSAETLTMTLNHASLAIGDNRLWLAVDVKEGLENGVEIDAALTEIKLSHVAQDISLQGNPDGHYTVQNVVVSHLGTARYTISGTWNFIPNMDGAKYAAEKGDQIVELMPAAADELIRLDITEFEISDSYSVKATFKVYSGVGDTKTLLWESTSATATTGPQTLLKSTASDGSMTIEFNAGNVYSAYYCKKGWTATVESYKPQAMRYVSCTATQSNSSDASVGGASQEILGVEVVTEFDKPALTLESMTFDLKGSETLIDAAHLYYTANGSTYDMSHQVGSTTTLGNQVTFTLATPTTLVSGTNHFWLAYDVKSTCNVGESLDASLVKIVLSDAEHAAAVDPDGARNTAKILTMVAGDNGTVVVSGSLMLYDDGGKDGNYDKDFLGHVTFKPATVGNMIKLTIESLDISSGAISIYEGTLVGGMYDYDVKITKYTSVPATTVSNADDGSYTLQFEADAYTSSHAGFSIKVEEYTPIALSFDTIVSKSIVAPKILKGAVGEKMLSIAVSVEGEKGIFSINELQVACPEFAQIDKASIYYTGTKTTFATTDLYAEVVNPTEATLTFAKDIEVLNPGTYHFWVTYTIKKTATLDQAITAQLTGLKVNGAVESLPVTQEIASGMVTSGMKGHFIIGSSDAADYATFAQAIAALKLGVEAPVVFEVEAGTYAEQLTLSEIAGTSLNSTVTFKAQAGAEVILSHTSYSIANSIDGADYVCFDSLQFSNTKDYTLMEIKNSAEHIQFKDCTFSGAGVGKLMESLDGGNHHLIIDACTFEGGKYAFYTSNGLSSTETGLVIKNSTISGFDDTALFILHENNAEISGNTIRFTEDKVSSKQKGMDVTMSQALIIANNKIELNGIQVGRDTYALYARSGNATTEDRVMIYNNSMVCDNFKSGKAAVAFNRDAAHIDFVYNTIFMTGQYGVKALYFYNPGSDITVKNNVIQSKAVGASPLIFYKSTQATTFAHNVYYNENGTFSNVAISDTGSQEKEVNFTSATELSLVDVEGIIVAEVMIAIPKDINGVSRGAQPTPGAYQFGSGEEPTSVEEIGIQTSVLVENHTLRIQGVEGSYRVVVYSMNGLLIYQSGALMGIAHVELNDTAEGIYIVRILQNTNQQVIKVRM